MTDTGTDARARLPAVEAHPDGSAGPAAIVDWLIVVLVAAFATSGVGLERPWEGSTAELALTGLVLALPLAVRRSRPLLCVTLVGLALILQELTGGSLGFASFMAALVAMFSVGRHVASVGRSAVGALVLAVATSIATAEGLTESPSDAIFPLFYFSAAWGLGRVVRVLELRAAQLRRLNEVLARDQETTARLAVAGERIRLARELHDVLAHTVMVMVWQAEEAEELLDHADDSSRRRSDLTRPRESLRNIQDAGRRGLAELRTLIDVLRDDGDLAVPAPQLTELRTLAELMSRSGLQVELEVEVPDETVPAWPPGLATALYRVVQESLTNVLRHSHADCARVSLTTEADGVRCTVVDDGPRRAEPRPGSGHGIAGMQERLDEYGGVVTAESRGAGFQVDAVVPLAGWRP